MALKSIMPDTMFCEAGVFRGTSFNFCADLRTAALRGGDPRDAEVRALRKRVAELQRKTSAKSLGAPAANADSSSPSARRRSLKRQGCSPTWSRRWDPRIPREFSCAPSSRRRRRSAMALSRCWVRSRPRKCGSERDTKLWRPLLRSETSCRTHCKRPRGSCTKLSRCGGNRRQSSWTHAHRWQLICRWQRPHLCVRRKDARRSWRL